jgi:hypothetical protein
MNKCHAYSVEAEASTTYIHQCISESVLSLFVIKNMVHSCCIVGCAQRQNKAKYISLHRIPSFPEEKRKQWINAIKRKEPWTPTQSSRVCSLHFLQGKLFLIYL